MSVEKSARRTWGRAPEGALAGAGAGVLAVIVELAARTISGLPSPVELLGDQGTRFIPGPIFEFLLGIFGHSAKYLYFTGIVLAQLVGLALLTALAFALRGLIIQRRALAAVAAYDDEMQDDDSETDAAEQASFDDVEADADQDGNANGNEADTDQQEIDFPDADEYTPEEQAALAAAVPTIQKPVGWWFSIAVAGVAWLFSGILVLPILGAGLFGGALPVGSGVVAASLLVPALAFGASLPLSQQALRWLAPRLIGSPKLQRAFSPSRRLFLKRVSIGLAILGVGALAWRFIIQGLGNGNAAGADSLDGPPPPERIVPPPTPHYGPWKTVKDETPELTPTDEFYYVSKNVYTDPSIDAASWELTVDGEGVEHPFTLSYQDLMKLPAVEQITTLECISNIVGGSLMSSARWTGIRLQDLLERAGVKTGATKVAFHAADQYTDSIHLSKALDPMTLLVYLMNGQPLPQEHGFPARMIVPGIYGMKHCKWITHIEVVNYNFLGYWQQEGWNDDAIINPGARIDVPFPEATLPVNRQTSIAGVAFAGTKGVSAVDVSTDNGHTWQRATLKQPLGAVTWTLWELPWTPTSQDRYALVARMIDLQGYYQQPVVAAPYPNGATGYDRIYVNVS
jgi:DMSO/TMAO reductase YedYZ molybdopterin-dependent catalytic subunit